MSTVFIHLASGERCAVDGADVPRLAPYSWWAWCGTGDEEYTYAITRIGDKAMLMHRFLMEPGPGMVVDHMNGDRLDNRRVNLRVCTHAQNLNNRKDQPDSLCNTLPRIDRENAPGLVVECGVLAPRELTPREQTVFAKLAAGQPIHRIAAALAVSASTISTHRDRILKKLGCNSNAELVRFSLGLSPR